MTGSCRWGGDLLLMPVCGAAWVRPEYASPSAILSAPTMVRNISAMLGVARRRSASIDARRPARRRATGPVPAVDT
jgi:hypothetical protein